MRIRQIYFREEHKEHFDKEFIPYFNEKANPYLESQVFVDLYEQGDHKGSEWYGALSWKFNMKSYTNGLMTKVQMEQDNYSHDVYTFNGKYLMGKGEGEEKNVFKYADRWHEGISDIIDMISEELGWSPVSELETPIVYYNYWIIKEELFERFIEEVMKPVMYVIDNNEKIRTLVERDANYRNHAGTQLDAEGCMKVFGKPYYTYHPFICERLMSVFIAQNNLKFKHLV